MEITEEDHPTEGENDDENEDGVPAADLAKISFHAILGNSMGTTMKLQGEIHGWKVLILIDSGSTHNFVAESIVKELAILVETIPAFGVQIGNGDIIRLPQNLSCPPSAVARSHNYTGLLLFFNWRG